MKTLNQLTRLLNNINKISEKIILEALPLMKELETTDNDLVDDFVSKYPGVEASVASSALQEASLDLVDDAKNIRKEIDEFSEAVILGEDGLEEGSNLYPFLLQVWSGDIYDGSGISGLELLYKDLITQLNSINYEGILNRASVKFEN